MGEITKLNEAPKFDENPWIEKSIEAVEQRTVLKQKWGNRTDQKGIVSAINPETGEVFQTSFVRRVEVDEDQFAKLYISNLSQLNELSTAGVRVLTYILTRLKPNLAEVIFKIEDCMTHCKYKSKNSVYKGLTELINAQIVARGWADSIIFINPLVFFNGNRVSFATEYIKKQNPNLKGKTLHRLAEARIIGKIQSLDE